MSVQLPSMSPGSVLMQALNVPVPDFTNPLSSSTSTSCISLFKAEMLLIMWVGQLYFILLHFK